ncbi:hypothetical protein R3P38DRAFT_3253182 [Favolaschia claudopus]|uniref:Uncharacterized protein n=1 Tax=Favolaschia claudopus TaxID=2862362 RepID=A0AAW0E6M2_9AGAR
MLSSRLRMPPAHTLPNTPQPCLFPKLIRSDPLRRIVLRVILTQPALAITQYPSSLSRSAANRALRKSSTGTITSILAPALHPRPNRCYHTQAPTAHEHDRLRAQAIQSRLRRRPRVASKRDSDNPALAQSLLPQEGSQYSRNVIESTFLHPTRAFPLARWGGTVDNRSSTCAARPERCGQHIRHAHTYPSRWRTGLFETVICPTHARAASRSPASNPPAEVTQQHQKPKQATAAFESQPPHPPRLAPAPNIPATHHPSSYALPAPTRVPSPRPSFLPQRRKQAGRRSLITPTYRHHPGPSTTRRPIFAPFLYAPPRPHSNPFPLSPTPELRAPPFTVHVRGLPAINLPATPFPSPSHPVSPAPNVDAVFHTPPTTTRSSPSPATLSFPRAVMNPDAV